MSSVSARPRLGHSVAQVVLVGTALIVVLLMSVASASAAERRDTTPAPAPAVSFTLAPTAVQAGVAETFTANATPGTGETVTQISWNLGSGNFTDATGASATTTFTTSGTVTVGVEVTDSDGQTATSAQTITVGPAAGTILSPAIVITPELKLASAKVSGDRVKVKLTCVFAVCRTSASLTTYERRRAGKLTALTANAGAKAARRAVVGSDEIRVPVGKTVTYTLKLNGRGQNLLKRFGKLPLALSFSGIKVTRHLNLKYAKPGRKPKLIK